MRSPTVACLVLCAAALLPAVARAGAPPRVGVIPQLAVNVDDRRAVALTEELAETLHQRLVVDAIGGSDVMRRLPADGLPDDCLVQPKCVADVAHRLDADQLLFVVLVQVGNDIQIDATWVDVATGRSVSRPRLMLDAESRAGSVFGEAATRLLPDAEIRRDTVVVGIPPTPRHITKPAWITGGAGAALLVGSIGLGISVRQTYNRCKDEDCSDGTVDGMHTRAVLADVAGGLAIGAGIATGILYYLSDDPGEAAPPSVGISGGPGTASISWRGTF